MNEKSSPFYTWFYKICHPVNTINQKYIKIHAVNTLLGLSD